MDIVHAHAHRILSVHSTLPAYYLTSLYAARHAVVQFERGVLMWGRLATGAFFSALIVGMYVWIRRRTPFSLADGLPR